MEASDSYEQRAMHEDSHEHKCTICGSHYSVRDSLCACIDETGERPEELSCPECFEEALVSKIIFSNLKQSIAGLEAMKARVLRGDSIGAIRHTLNPEAEVRKQLDSATELIFQLVSVIQSQRAELEAK